MAGAAGGGRRMPEGRLHRAVLLDGCPGRLARRGEADNLIAHRQIYQALKTTLHEVARRVRDLVALLPGGPSTVASPAQADLRRPDEAGRLATGTLAEASRAALARPDKKLAPASFPGSMLPSSILERAAELPSTVTVAFGHARPEIEQKAVTLLAGHRQQLDSGAREQIAAATDSIPPGLRSQLAAPLGPAEPGEPG